MINLTEQAVSKIKEISEAEEIGHTSLRLRVLGGGCAGFSYDIYFDNNPTELDEVFTQDEVSIIIDPLSFQYLDGVTVGYEIQPLAEGFTFKNPNVASTCGCGNSFSV